MNWILNITLSTPVDKGPNKHELSEVIPIPYAASSSYQEHLVNH